jgi:hypothetical protein
VKRLTRWMVVAIGAMALTPGAPAGDCLFRTGVHNIQPKSNNNATVSVDGAAMLTLAGSCYVSDNVAIDVLGSLPFKVARNICRRRSVRSITLRRRARRISSLARASTTRCSSTRRPRGPWPGRN